MSEIDVILATTVIGLGATAFMDVFAWLQNRFLHIPGLNYALVGRWLIGMRNGQFAHNTILQSSPQLYERTVGWVFHYAIGVFFVGCMLTFMGANWLEAPNLWNPMVIGVVSVLAPLFIMQPAFGFGFAASKTPSPWIARRRSLIAHLSFGLGIYVAGMTWVQLSF